jgi:LPPG:FO 2-phospho-L-lactate transferase
VQLKGQAEFSIIVNTAEDVEISGLYVSPDLDTVTYTLAGIVNEETWYGIRGDTFEGHEKLMREGKPELLRIGDRDREVKQRRTELLRWGKRLSEITRELCSSFGIAANVMPMSDDCVQTRVFTEAGPMRFHEYWVARRARDRVTGVAFEGIEDAKPGPGVIEAIDGSEAIIIGPSNPVTSIGPIVAIEEIRKALVGYKDKVIALSPVIGNSPVSGPAGALMQGLGYEVSPLGVARIYKDLIATLIIDKRDEGFIKGIDQLGIKILSTDLIMPDMKSKVRLAETVLSLLKIPK